MLPPPPRPTTKQSTMSMRFATNPMSTFTASLHGLRPLLLLVRPFHTIQHITLFSNHNYAVAWFVWAYVPNEWLAKLDITYYPDKYWAAVVPLYTLAVRESAKDNKVFLMNSISTVCRNGNARVLLGGCTRYVAAG